MRGLGPGTHDKQTRSGIVMFVDGRAKPGHDAVQAAARTIIGALLPQARRAYVILGAYDGVSRR
jgi:hypothetical protein